MRWRVEAFMLIVLFKFQCNGLVTRSQQKGGPRVVHLPLQRNVVQDPVAQDRRRIAKRRGTVQADLDNVPTLYFFNASLGTPAQEFHLQLDTGSSDLWVNAASSSLCNPSNPSCQVSGTYKANSSSTYEYLNSEFNISYADGSSAHGDYATDTLWFGDIGIENFQFGIGYTSSSPLGVLGIGYPENEVQATRLGQRPYDNLPARLLADERLAANAYSVWLDDVDSKTGSLLFGGVDRSQYHGNLVTLPVEKAGSTYREFLVTMTGLEAPSGTISDDMALAVLLDTGSSLTYLPNDLVKSLYQAVNATWVEQSQSGIVSCAVGFPNDNITFHFSKPLSISVSLNELVLPTLGRDGRPLKLQDGSDGCLFGIFPSGNGAGILGDTFLRSAYVVYDMANNEISLAQSKADANKNASDIVEIRPGKNQIPDATLAPNPVAAKSGLPGLGGATASLPSKWRCLGFSMFAIIVSGVGSF